MLTLNNLRIPRAPGVYLDLSLYRTGCIVISGHNGSGKTSVLRAIANFAEYDGTILYYSKDIKSDINRFRKLLFFMGTRSPLDENLSVVDNIPYDAPSEIIEYSLGYLGLYEYKDRDVRYLSDGLKKRLMLLRLLISNREIWLLDEPFTHLDYEAISILEDMILAKLTAGGLVIIAHHGELNCRFKFQYIEI